MRETNTTSRAALMAVAAVTVALLSVPAFATHQDSYSMEILVDGRPLEKLRGRGSSYVEALEGREYAVRITNRSGQRVAVALAVDGLNSIDARRTTAAKASKWVIQPWDSITIDGWQTDSEHARRFFFTSEEESYGAWLGRTDDLGNVTAAIFRERQPAWWNRLLGREERFRSDAAPGDARGAAPPSASRQKSAGSAPEGAAEGLAGGDSLSDDHAATGIGREVDHQVRRVELELDSNPAATLRVRYEYRESLVRLGVLPGDPDPIGRREHGTGFEDFEFSPDPYRTR